MAKPPKPTDTDATEALPEDEAIIDPDQESDAESDDTNGAADRVEDAEIVEDVPPEGADEPTIEHDASDPELEPDNDLEEGQADKVEDVVAHEPKEESPAQSERQPAKESSGGWIVPFLAGAIAAAAGFVGAQYILPELTSSSDSAVVELSSRLEAMEQKLADAEAQTSQNTNAIEGFQALDIDSRLAQATENSGDEGAEDIARIDDALAQLQSSIADATNRITTLESAPAPEALPTGEMESEAMQAFEAQLQTALAAAQAELEASRKQAAEVEQNAADAAARAEAQTALQFIGVALVSGEPYADALATVSSSGAEIPVGLSASAESGVPTLPELQERFPDAARKALDAARRSETPDGVTNRVLGFLQTQTGARSLTPRDGDDPDAVLSRAEAALRDGDPAAALAELGSLPDAGREAMSEWTTSAQKRADAEVGASDLQAALSSQ